MADIQHLWPPMRQAVEAMLASDKGREIGLYVVSGYRSIETQTALYADALRRYGSPQAAGKWVAPPGRSHHGPQLNDHGDHPGPWGMAVDLGVPGLQAVSGKWPENIRNKIRALGFAYGLQQVMPWEDWHYEPVPGFPRPSSPTHPTIEEDPMGLAPVIDPKRPANPEGQLPHWTTDAQGDLYAWNGARDLLSLNRLAKSHPPIVGIALEPGGDGVILFGDDGHQAPDGRWVQSTYKITVGMTPSV